LKPVDHPDFYRMAPPKGASRDSSIVLDRDGRFWHEGERVENEALNRAMRTWISRHPDDGRLILTNGYDWCYFRAEDAPFIVDTIRIEGGGATGVSGAEPDNDEPANSRELQTKSTVMLRLFDDSEEPLDPSSLRLGADGVVYARVKGGSLEARFSRHAQTDLGPLLTSGDPPVIRVAGVEYTIPPR
jgi:uncharacterized protein